MGNSQQLLEGVIIMLVLIVLAILLRKVGLLEKSNSSLISNLVLKVTLPALIFSSLAVQQFTPDLLFAATIVATVEIICIIIAWIVSKIIKLNRSETGALMLVSAFGMSTMLGYPIISQVFPNNFQAIEDAVITSELGVGLILFILGPIIAMHYGESDVEGKAITISIKRFIISPIFIALILGIAVSFLPVPKDSQVVITLAHLFKHVSNANLFLVALTIGLIIETGKSPNIYAFLVVAIILKLIIQPTFAQLLGSYLEINKLEQLSIGEVAQQVGLQPSTLRYYESIALLPPARRVSGQRRYTPEVIQRLQIITVAKEIGFSLDEIRVLLDGLSLDSPPSERWQSIAEAKLPEVESLIQRAQAMKQILKMGLNCECITIEDCFTYIQ